MPKMLVSIVIAIGSFLFESAASGIVGQAAYEAISHLYQKRYKKSLISLYIQAFKLAVRSWKPTLERIAEPGAIIQVDDRALEGFLSDQNLEVTSLSTLTEVELSRALAKNIGQFLIIPGHRLADSDIEEISVRVIRYAAELFTEEISRDEIAFRTAVLEEARLATFDREIIIEILERIPIMLNAQISSLDKKLDMMMSKIERILSTVDLPSGLDFESPEEFKQTCASSVVHAISTIPKYNAHLYVSRETVEWEFAQFLQSENPCLLVLGEAGVGKTNLLCHLARNYSTKILTLFFRGTTHIVGRLGFHKVLSDELSSLSKHMIDPARVIQFLDEFLNLHNRVHCKNEWIKVV